MSATRALTAALAAIAVAATAAAPGPSAHRLRGSEGLARAYDAILDARFDRASYRVGARLWSASSRASGAA